MQGGTVLRVRVDEAVRQVAALPGGSLVAIDGLPVSGKSTLADRLITETGVEAVFLDDFVLPESQWPQDRRPAFPFSYIRYADFIATVQALHRDGAASYFPYDWSSNATSSQARRVGGGRTVLVEGVSALHPQLSPLYSLRIFVESDASTVLGAALARGVGAWESHWRDWFLPSVDLYMATNPVSRADLLLPGRGAAAA
jgi:uridine kinase